MRGKPAVRSTPRHVSVVAVPDATVSTLFGIYDVMSVFERMDPPGAGAAPFHVEIVGERVGPLALASGVTIEVHRAIDTIDATDIVIVPSVVLGPDGWTTGRYPQVIDWIRRMHERGALLCSACLGLFLLAETGLFDGRDATVHYNAAGIFAATYPAVPIHPERVLMISGVREELVSSGASVAWHDLVLHLIARYAGSAAARDAARMFALQWHHEGFTPYIVFDGRSRPRRRGDRERATLAEHAFLGGEPGGADGEALEARRTHLQAPLRERDRPGADCLRPASADRRREEAARAKRRAGRRDQLARRLRRSRLLPAALQADDRPRAGRVPKALPHSRLPPADRPVQPVGVAIPTGDCALTAGIGVDAGVDIGAASTS